MSDKQYFETIKNLLLQSKKAANQKRYVPGKKDFINGIDILVKKTDEFLEEVK